MVHNSIFDFAQVGLASEQVVHRSDGFTVARDYQIEVTEISIYVEGKPVSRDPPGDVYADGRDLSHEPPESPLPPAVLAGSDAFWVVGAIAGG